MIIATYVPKMTDGGVERVVSNLLPLWINMGHQVVLYTDVPASALDYSYPQEIKRIVLGELSLSERESFWKESLSNEKVDVMVYHHWLSGFMHTDCECIQALGIPFILYTHGHFTARFTHYDDYMKTWPSLVAKCDLVLSLTELNNRFYEMNGAKARVVRNPISDELVKLSEDCAKKQSKNTEALSKSVNSYVDSKNITSESKNLKSAYSPKLVWIGRFDKGKRPMDALEIFKLVQKQIPNAQLYFVGSGDSKIEAKLKSRAGKNVFFEGYSTDVFSYLKTADLMLMTSEKEGYPTIITESYAAGVPIAMYNLPYLKPCQDKKGMLLAEIGDKVSLANQIIDYLRANKQALNLNAKDQCKESLNISTSTARDLRKEAQEYFKELCSYDVTSMWNDVFSEVLSPANNNANITASSAYIDKSATKKEDNTLSPSDLDTQVKQQYEAQLKLAKKYTLRQRIRSLLPF